MHLRLAGDLAAWTAKCKLLEEASVDSDVVPLPKGKPGNMVTRMYARTGWWPIKKNSENWDKVISQFEVSASPTFTPKDSQPLTKELGPEVKIREVVLEAFRGKYLKQAEDIKKAYAAKSKRRMSKIPCTVYGKGFTKGDDLALVKANDLRIEQEVEAKVRTHTHITPPYTTCTSYTHQHTCCCVNSDNGKQRKSGPRS